MASRADRLRAVRAADILDAARWVFVAKGYQHATMEQIARQARYTKKSVYAYFPAKADLLLAVMEDRLTLLVGRVSAAQQDACSGAQRVSRIAHACLAAYRDEPAGFNLFHLPLAFPQDLMRRARFKRVNALYQQLLGQVADAFAAGQRDGTLRAGVDPAMAALFVTSATAGILHGVSQKGAVFEKVHGVDPETFVAFSLQMLGASFLANTHGQRPP